MILNKQIFRNFEKEKHINLITVDEIIHCSGKSLFANLLKKNLKKDFSDIFILSKDLFLSQGVRELKITIKIKYIKKLNQNNLHYDHKKLRFLIKFFDGSFEDQKFNS